MTTEPLYTFKLARNHKLYIIVTLAFNIFCCREYAESSLSSGLLLRISPNTFAFIQILPMSLSSRNRSIFNTFRPILPCVAPVCEGMHYHKTGVPWQMNNIFIMFLYLLKSSYFLIFKDFLQLSFFL